MEEAFTLFVCYDQGIYNLFATGDFMKKVPTATCALRDRYIVSIERVYTPSTFYIKSAVHKCISILCTQIMV